LKPFLVGGAERKQSILLVAVGGCRYN